MFKLKFRPKYNLKKLTNDQIWAANCKAKVDEQFERDKS